MKASSLTQDYMLAAGKQRPVTRQDGEGRSLYKGDVGSISKHQIFDRTKMKRDNSFGPTTEYRSEDSNKKLSSKKSRPTF